MSKAQIKDCFVYETYELTLNRYLVIGENKVKIDEQVKTTLCVRQDQNKPPKAIIINEMLKKLKDYLLKEID